MNFFVVRGALAAIVPYVAIGLAIAANRLIVADRFSLEPLVLFAIAITLLLWAVAQIGAFPVGPATPALAGEAISSIGAPPGSLTPGSDADGRVALEPVAQARFGALALPSRAALLAGAPKVVGAVAVAVLAGMTWIRSAGNEFGAGNLLPWFGAIVIFLATFWEAPSGGWRAWHSRLRATVTGWRPNPLAVGFLLMVALGVFFRFYHLAETPLEATSDHAEKLLDVWDVVHGRHPIFFERNTGREPLQFYVGAATVQLLGIPINHLALKIGTAFFGLTSVIWAFFLARQLFGSGPGLIAGALTAMSQWGTAIDRVGLRFPFTAAFATPTLLFLIRAFQMNRRNDWLLCGLFLGIGLNTYISMRIVPLLVVALIGLKVLWDLSVTRWAWLAQRGAASGQPPEATSLALRFWGNAALAGVATLLLFLPLGRFMVDQPQVFWYRVLTRAGEAERQIADSPIVVFASNVKNALLMFNVRGDGVPINTLPGSPVLDSVTGALLVLGAGLAVWRLVRAADRRYAYLLVALFMLLLPSTLSISFPGENPSVARTGGAIPVVMTLAAVPLGIAALGVYRWLTSLGAPPLQAGLRASALPLLLLVLGITLNYDWYFVRYDRHWRASGHNTTELGGVVREFVATGGDLRHAYHVPWPHWADTRLIGGNAGDPSWENSVDLANPAGQQRLRSQAADPARKLYLVNREDDRALNLLRQTYPDGEARRFNSEREGRDFWIFTAPGRGAG